MIKNEDDLEILKREITNLCVKINDVKFLKQIYILLIRHVQRKKREED